MSDLELLDRQRAHIQSELARRGMAVEDVLQGGELTGCRHLRPGWLEECVGCANERRASIYRTQAETEANWTRISLDERNEWVAAGGFAQQASMYGIEP